jgi:hypothetical protein
LLTTCISWFYYAFEWRRTPVKRGLIISATAESLYDTKNSHYKSRHEVRADGFSFSLTEPEGRQDRSSRGPSCSKGQKSPWTDSGWSKHLDQCTRTVRLAYEATLPSSETKGIFFWITHIFVKSPILHEAPRIEHLWIWVHSLFQQHYYMNREF